jgi:acetoin utilization deacetylase AcuC-like enzyme
MVLNEKVRPWIDVSHPERPERVSLTYELLGRSGALGKLEQVPARRATEEELELVHTPEHVAALREACSTSELRQVGPEARARGPRSWDAALLAAGGLLAALDLVVAGAVDNAYALLRPPGHHASTDTAMGFCLFNSIAIAARRAQRRQGLERVAIVDWDVHHGNGTQAIFYDDPSVLFLSLHQDGLYPPESGTLAEIGHNRGEGHNLNIPLPPGTGDAGYERAFEVVVEPVIRAFRPDLILVSAGQDPAAADPLGRMSVTTEGFRSMSMHIRALAQDVCEGRLLAFQEGGYSLSHTPLCTLAIVEALAGLAPSFTADPLEIDAPGALGGPQLEAVERAARAYSRWWPL